MQAIVKYEHRSRRFAHLIKVHINVQLDDDDVSASVPRKTLFAKLQFNFPSHFPSHLFNLMSFRCGGVNVFCAIAITLY